MKVTWGRRARRDLRELVTYIADDSVQAAEIVAARILKAAESLARTPRSGRPGRVAGTRERIVGRTRYILAYQVVSGRVRILRVYHGPENGPRASDPLLFEWHPEPDVLGCCLHPEPQVLRLRLVQKTAPNSAQDDSVVCVALKGWPRSALPFQHIP